ncbi:MAG: hypothetical protein UW16_C0021G0013 [Microgenomates group bacterium GW2011_GWC1_44_10]|nr:MAG: hypothetical protein UW16_C0021G0013 [Microgenomates group bacterium GW2011_GWC1_44_10]
MENSSKRDPLNIIIAIAVIVIIILLGYMGSLALKNNLISLPKSNKTSPASTKVTLNPDALYLSFPITNLSSAKITGKSSNSLIVEVNAQTLPNTDSKVLSFKVAITDTTSITQPIPNIPYAFKSPTTNTPPLPPIANQLAITLKDLSIGETVNISLADDLRFTSNRDIQAIAISKQLESNSLSGPITEVSGNTIKVSGFVSSFAPPAMGATPPTAPVNKIYTISLTSDTELSSFDQTGPIKMALSDLKVGSSVIVYSADPITSTSFSAALVTIHPTVAPPPIPPAPGSSSPAPATTTPPAPPQP